MGDFRQINIARFEINSIRVFLSLGGTLKRNQWYVLLMVVKSGWPVDMVNIPLFTEFYTSQVVVSDFWAINSSSSFFFFFLRWLSKVWFKLRVVIFWCGVCRGDPFFGWHNKKISTGWWLQVCFIPTPTWGRFPFWRIFFKWVGSTTN